MFILSPDTVLNTDTLLIRWVPRKYLALTPVWPRGGSWRLWARLIFEKEVLRYALTLLPFVVAALVWTEYAVVIAQAPIPMLIVIYLVESRVLRPTDARRRGLVSDIEADAGLDMLRARARSILGRIAARRGLTTGTLHLVIEQSDLLRVPPLTLVSVQYRGDDAARPELLRLTRDERAMIEAGLFDEGFSERGLQHIGLARRIETHDLTFEPAQLSAHARLSAMMAGGQGARAQG